MKILFEICHPAHVHYFRNIIREMEKNGHQIKILAQDRGIIHKLLQYYKLKFEVFPNLPKNILGKFFFIPYIDLIFYKAAKKFEPDILIGFAGAYISHVAWIQRIPSIVFDDTDSARLSHLAYKSFASTILTPNCFSKNFGDKHIKFASYMELSYLHPKYSGDLRIIDDLNNNRKRVFIRFVSWRATHDVGQKGFSYDDKIRIVKSLKQNYDVIISSEDELPEAIKEYKIDLAPEKIHSLLASVDLYIGEGATMASECAILGTPAIYVNTLNAGTLMEQEKFGLIFIFSSGKGVLEKAIEILETKDLKKLFNSRRNEMLANKIDLTAYMLWFIENYPASFKLMKKDPNYQYHFQ